MPGGGGGGGGGGRGGFSFGGAVAPAAPAAVGGFGAPAAGAGAFGGASASGGNMFGGGGFGAPSPPSPEEKIHDAIVENDLVSVTALLDGGANVNDFDHVLRPACAWDRVEMLQLFDARGADLLITVFGGSTLLHTCSNYGAVKCANFLLSKGIDHKKKGGLGGDKSSLDICRVNGQGVPFKRDGSGGGNTQASEPSPERKEIEKLILSKMKSEEHYSQKT